MVMSSMPLGLGVKLSWSLGWLTFFDWSTDFFAG